MKSSLVTVLFVTVIVFAFSSPTINVVDVAFARSPDVRATDVLKKVQTAQAAPATGVRWFFLLTTAAGVVGPFKSEADCNEIRGWAANKYPASSVTRCWDN